MADKYFGNYEEVDAVDDSDIFVTGTATGTKKSTFAKIYQGFKNRFNVSDEKPTITEASSDTDIASGDTFSTILGKIKYTLSSFRTKISNLTSQVNSHTTSISELNSNKSNNGHTHDDRYYTETEVNNLLTNKVSKSGDTINGDVQVNGAIRCSEDKVSMWSDNEGGNFSFTGSDGTKWEIDAFDGNARFFNYTNNYPGIGIDKNGTFFPHCGLQIEADNGMWIQGMNTTRCLLMPKISYGNSYYPFIKAVTIQNNVFNMGGIEDYVGFYGFYNGRTENNYDWTTCWNVGTGLLSHSKDMDIGGALSVHGAINFYNTTNFRNNNVYGVNTLYFMQGNTGHITNYSNQQMYFASSGETDYEVFLGVRESGWRFCPNANGNITCGSPNFRWGNGYFSSSSIVTSDRNLKENISHLTDKHMKFFMKLKPVSFTFIDGTSGRTHIGFIAQDVESAMLECGLSDLDFAGFCKDQKYETVTKIVESVNEETGETKTQEVEDIVPVENEYIYSLRYEEFIALNTAAIQYNCKRIADLEDKLNKIANVLNIDLSEI